MKETKPTLEEQTIGTTIRPAPRNGRVPKEDASYEEIREAASHTGRAAESFLPEEIRHNGFHPV